MTRVVVRSRSGNVVLTVVGAIYAVGALVALIAFAFEVAGGAAGLLDRALQVALLAAVVGGAWFVLTGLKNLTRSRPDRTASATRS